MKKVNFNINGMKKRPSYDEVLELVVHPKDKIKLPNRTATFIARSNEMSRFLDSTIADLKQDDENIALQRNIKYELEKIARNTGVPIAQLRTPVSRPFSAAMSVGSSSSHSKQEEEMHDIDIEMEQRKEDIDRKRRATQAQIDASLASSSMGPIQGIMQSSAAAAMDDEMVDIPQPSSSSYGPVKHQHLPSTQPYIHHNIANIVQRHSGEIVNPSYVDTLGAQSIKQPSTSSVEIQRAPRHRSRSTSRRGRTKSKQQPKPEDMEIESSPPQKKQDVDKPSTQATKKAASSASVQPALTDAPRSKSQAKPRSKSKIPVSKSAGSGEMPTTKGEPVSIKPSTGDKSRSRSSGREEANEDLPHASKISLQELKNKMLFLSNQKKLTEEQDTTFNKAYEQFLKIKSKNPERDAAEKIMRDVYREYRKAELKRT